MARFLTDDERYTETPEPKVIGHCHVCGGEIYDGERYGTTEDGNLIHCATDHDCDCIDDVWSGLSAAEKIERLGYEVIT